MLASGDKAAADFAAPVLDAVGAKTVWLGEAGNGSRMKLVTNDWVLGQTALVAEAMRLCAALELEPSAFLDAIDGAPVGSAYAQIKGHMMLSGEFPPNFPLEHGTKDSRLIVAAAREAGLDLPIAESYNEYFIAALEAGRGKEDMAVIYDYVATADTSEE
jgi:3-hydroxyisobutyrate dehydrogenase